MKETFEVRLERTRKLSPSTRDFRFVKVDGSAVQFLPGQFFRFVFQDDKGEFERSYSLCNFGNDVTDSSFLDLVISVVANGRASKLLFAVETGLTATVSGPFGRLLVPEPLPKRLFLVATSVGIAPYMPMLTQLEPALKARQLEVHLLYGTRDSTEFVYGDQLLQFAASYQDFHLSVCYSREAGSTARENVSITQGYVQSRLMALAPDPSKDHVLLCGNPAMVDDTYTKLKALGFGVKQVVREKYVFAKDKPAVTRKAMTEAQKSLLAEKMKKYQSQGTSE